MGNSSAPAVGSAGAWLQLAAGGSIVETMSRISFLVSTPAARASVMTLRISSAVVGSDSSIGSIILS
jgi:hypothetical protein